MSRAQSLGVHVRGGKFRSTFILCHLHKCGAIAAGDYPLGNAIALKSL